MAIQATPMKPRTWKRFVDNSFCIIKKTAILTFYDSLSNIDTFITFTIELEQDTISTLLMVK